MTVGDMYFVLPGTGGDPVETLRYEALRTGLQDYALLKLAQDALSSSAASELFSQVGKLVMRTEDLSEFSKVNDSCCDDDDIIHAEELYSLDPDDYDAAMHLVVHALASLGRE